MSEDALVNTGAMAWPDDFTASVMVRRMQVKLHRWAGEDPSRRFGDLFNLVYDPAFLVHAWERVSANKPPGLRGSIRPLRPESKPGSGSGLSWARSATR
jgi:RNA-directed DNA polymerase